jgi:subtilisin family serine protease
VRQIAVRPKLGGRFDVTHVEAAAKLRPHCDLAHVSARLFTSGGGGRPETGRGVLVGIVDTGIDTRHPAFNKGGKTRIVDYLDQETSVRHDAGAINRGRAVASPDVDGHGTHVAGIAAGNGAGSPNAVYRGVAPEADLAIVKTTFDSDDVVAGVAHVFDVATRRKQACVVNLSLGGHFGGHDGTSVMERTLDQLAGPGRLVVVSAGNEGSEQIHASTVLRRQPGERQARWVADFELRARVVEGRNMGLLWVQLWHQREDDIRIQLRTPNGELVSPTLRGEIEVDRQVYYVHATHEVAPYSGDHCTTFLVSAVDQARWLTGWSIIATEDAQGPNGGSRVGTIHAWILDGETGRFTRGHTRSHLVGMPGTAFSVITVASYATRRQWATRDPEYPEVIMDAVNLEDVSYFSSPGPTRDGNNKPEVAAPGQSLVAPLSGDATLEEMPTWLRLPDVPYAALQGTSMSAPYVTGALALLLQRRPDIDWAEAKRRLILSTHQDPFTTPCWNERWGYGKLDIERLLTLEPS